jgi:hypothetical protein
MIITKVLKKLESIKNQAQYFSTTNQNFPLKIGGINIDFASH